jgi:type I restriction enzyme R subunit
MSALLDEIIAARKAKAIEYEDYLRRIAALAKQVEAGQADDTPDATVKQVRPDDWRGVEPRERVIKQALFDILQDVAEVERIFLIIKAQKEY